MVFLISFMPTRTPLASGLALVEPDAGMLIAFNAAPGSIAPIEPGPYGAFARDFTTGDHFTGRLEYFALSRRS
jgi:hypothetical protein